MTLIVLEDIVKHYSMGQEIVRAVNGVNLNIEVNEYVAITGSSGSGKSTMMNILGALETPTSGFYRLKGCDIGQLNNDALADIRNQEIGFIFQSFNLLPRLSALKNVMQPLVYRGVGMKAREQKAQAVLKRVGLADRVSHLPSQLSGGQRQRVAIARALVTKPSILLADEPTGNLDSRTTTDIMNLFDELHNEGNTIVMVTHDQDIARRCHRIIHMQDGKIATSHFHKV
jgi:putative ABC transport system ATP-binding protein